MSKQIAIIGAHGIGDCILSLQCAHYVGNHECNIFIASRDEVFNVVKTCFDHLFNIYHADPKLGEDNFFLKSKDAQNFFYSKYIHVYYTVPDLLFRNPFAFDYKKYNVTPQTIKSTRLLARERMPFSNIVYVGLTSSTKGYNYPDLKLLLNKLGKENPAFIFYFPKISSWAGDNIDFGDLSGLPKNVFIQENPTFDQSLNVLKQSCYGIFTCNGPSHLAYQYGIPRLVLDPQFDKLPWIARWKEDYNECLSISTNFIDICRVVSYNLNQPETQLVPRKFLLNGDNRDWAKELIFKY